MGTSDRMLRLLSLLQTHRYWPGGELAERLEVSPRTLRRDVDRLRDLGYQVDAVRGVAGGYQLRAGGSMAPLLLEDEEAVAVAVALRGTAGAAVGVRGGPDGALQALTKVLGLMPPRLRRQMEAVGSQTDTPQPWADAPVLDAAALGVVAQACRDHEPLRFDYAGLDAEASHRWVEPHRLVALGRRWYLVAYDRDRQDWRSFRVDRLSAPEPTGQRFRPRELPGGDAVAFVQNGIHRWIVRHHVRVRVAAEPETVRPFVGRWGRVTPLEGAQGGSLLEMEVDSLSWPLMVLGEVGADFVVESPPELVEAVAEVAARFARAAG